MVKSRKIIGKKLKDIITICQNALKGKINVEDTNLLDYLPSLRDEIKKGKYEYSSIKAFSLSSHVLDLKTRKLLGEFFQGDIKSKKISPENFSNEFSIESALTYPINGFKDFIIENDIVNAYLELLKIRKIKPDYSIGKTEEICVSEQNGFKEVDSFEQDKNQLFTKLISLNEKNIDFNTLQNNWEDAVTNLIYLVHLAQEGRVNLDQNKANDRIIIEMKI